MKTFSLSHFVLASLLSIPPLLFSLLNLLWSFSDNLFWILPPFFSLLLLEKNSDFAPFVCIAGVGPFSFWCTTSGAYTSSPVVLSNRWDAPSKMMDRCKGWCSEGSLLVTHIKRGGSYCSEVLFTIFRVTIVYQQLCGSLKTLYRNGFLRGAWIREQKEIARERVAAMPWPNDHIASVTTLWLECLLRR